MTATAVAIAQFAPTAGAEANLQHIEELVVRAAGRGADVVLFPEYSSYFVDPFDESLARNAQDIDGPFVSGLAGLAAAHGVHLVAGLLERGRDGRRVRNTVVAVDGSGVLARYRKLHLYDAFGQRESDWVEPGEPERPETFELGGLTFGLMTCYDLRFPEMARTLVDAGADAIVVPAAWVRGPLKESQWELLLRARAVENTAYVVAAGQNGARCIGNSMVVDPMGSVVAGCGNGTGIATALLDGELVGAVRATNPSLANRRYRVIPNE